MPQITSIEPQKKNPSKFNVYIDGQFAFGAGEDLIVEYKILPGKQITQEELNKLLNDAEVGKLIERIYGLLSIRIRSEKEIRDYLKNLSFKRKIKDQDEISDSSIELVIEKLKQKELIDDRKFAQAWVEARRRSKLKGNRALQAELYQKGIGREIIEETLRQDSGQASEEDLAKLALEKKMKSWQNLPPQELRKKALQFLLRKGFDYSKALEAVAKVVKIA